MQKTSKVKLILPDIIIEQIWKKYFTFYVIKSIEKLRILRYNDILNHVIEHIKPNILSQVHYNIIWNLTDIGDFTQLNHIHKELTNNEYSFGYYHWFSIAITLDKFYSQPLLKQQQQITDARNNIPIYSFQNPECDYFEKHYMNFIDYKDSHSGSSGGYCISNITAFIMRNKTDKLILWATHICNNVINNN